jgi:hypothetical protein
MSRENFRAFIRDHYGDLPEPPRDATGGIVPPLEQSTSYINSDAVPPLPPGIQQDALPDFKKASDIKPNEIKLPELLIEGFLHRGCKAILSGGSKSFKSWCLMDMGISIAHGIDWWGMPCKKGNVLYLNFELLEPFFDDRLVTICREKNVLLPENFLVWNLRNKCYDLAILANVLRARVQSTHQEIDLIIVDPIYKALGDLDENSAGDMTQLMNLIEDLSVQLGAAVVFGAHFSKGNQSAKEAKDRPSGSGVFIRDPDAVLVMTRHQQEGCYVIESELRNLPSLPPFVVRWDFPLMVQDEGLDPRQLYDPTKRPAEEGEKNNSSPAFSEQDILNCLPKTGATDNLWRKQVLLRFGKAGPMFYTFKASLLQKNSVTKTGNRYFPVHFKFDEPPPPPPIPFPNGN